MATSTPLPLLYEVLGVVDAAMARPIGIVPTSSLMDALADQAVESARMR